jgi:hypothetical protein
MKYAGWRANEFATSATLAGHVREVDQGRRQPGRSGGRVVRPHPILVCMESTTQGTNDRHSGMTPPPSSTPAAAARRSDRGAVGPSPATGGPAALNSVRPS